ncbi:MAG TPA: hypothetical protein EYG92_08330, partial [Lutibacter sp.]|nr:hypothetical protein [Lutibacter sp.]
MNKISTLIITIIISINLYSQTPISGNQSGTWSLSNSPYEVMGELTVPTGQTLIIEAGVEINFKGHYKFNVDGKILATGTEAEGIIFTTDNQATGWGGVRLDGTPDISTFTFCTFEYGKTSGSYPDMHGGAVLLLNANAEFYNCIFAHNDATADNNGIGGAVYAFNTGTSTETLTRFIDCQFTDNHAYGEGGAMRLTNDGHTEITRCQFINNNCGYGGGAIHIYTALDTQFTDCLFYQNSSNNSGGGAIKAMNPSVTLDFINCTFAYNAALGAGEGGALDLAYAEINMVNSIIYENTQTYGGEINIGMNAYAEINYSNLEMPADATGANNTNVNPLFVATATGDFHLQSTSPCIDAGTDVGLPFAGTAPDMGCYEYGFGIDVIDYTSDDFTIYPNPSKGLLQIKTNTSMQNIKLIDVLGKIVMNKSLNGDKNGFIDT